MINKAKELFKQRDLLIKTQGYMYAMRNLDSQCFTEDSNTPENEVGWIDKLELNPNIESISGKYDFERLKSERFWDFAKGSDNID